MIGRGPGHALRLFKRSLSSAQPWAVTQEGPSEYSTTLARALDLQWRFGFPMTPSGRHQYTHGIHPYPAGMQATAASELLSLVPGDTIMDPFLGSGTTLVEAMLAGRKGPTTGQDSSPLALFVAHHQTLRLDDVVLESIRKAASDIVRLAEAAQLAPSTLASKGPSRSTNDTTCPKCRKQFKKKNKLFEHVRQNKCNPVSWDSTRAAMVEHFSTERSPERAVVAEALWFCLSAVVSEPLATDPSTAFLNKVERYTAAVEAFRLATSDDQLSPAITWHDARNTRDEEGNLLPVVDGVVTSPPYPAVYDYLSNARQVRAELGCTLPDSDTGGEVKYSSNYILSPVPTGRDWPQAWRSGEMGARKPAMKNMGEFERTWAEQQVLWLQATRERLRPGGRIALIIGDGDSTDTHQGTLDAAGAAGLRFMASATIKPSVNSKNRPGNRRVEHAILLEKL